MRKNVILSKLTPGNLLSSALFSIVSLLAQNGYAQAEQVVVGEDSRTDLSITVYNNNFALVRETRASVLPRGLVEVEFQDVPKTIDPTSVTVKSLGKGRQFSVLEQNYQYDLLNKETLLSKFVGKKLKYSRTILEGASYEKILREGYLLAMSPEIVDFGDEIEIDPEGTITLSYVPEELISKPTLIWLLENDVSGSQLLETSYLANGISWQADYIMVLDDKASEFDLSAWVTMNNQSGARFRNAQIKLVAGDVNRVAAQARPEMYMEKRMMASDMAGAREESLFEYHLYTMPRKTNLANNQTKQLKLMSAEDVGFTKDYILSTHVGNQRMAQSQTSKFDVKLNFDNRKKNNLGMPLPAGRVRVYQQDLSGALQLVGEDRVKHTPEDETVTLSVGKAFDLVAERKQTDYRRIGDRGVELSYQVTVRNHKKEKAMVTINEKLFGDWVISSESVKGEKIDVSIQQYKFSIEGGGTQSLDYTARITY
ncbi:MAG: hypothetical protein ACJAVI_000046 [Candidatus Azotimanducaceae bacterium]|jgi:hypothetical protein